MRTTTIGSLLILIVIISGIITLFIYNEQTPKIEQSKVKLEAPARTYSPAELVAQQQNAFNGGDGIRYIPKWPMKNGKPLFYPVDTMVAIKDAIAYLSPDLDPSYPAYYLEDGKISGWSRIPRYNIGDTILVWAKNNNVLAVYDGSLSAVIVFMSEDNFIHLSSSNTIQY